MEACSLHPLDLSVVHDYVRMLTGNGAAREPLEATAGLAATAVSGSGRSNTVSEGSLNEITAGLAWELAKHHPTYVQYGLGLTPLEARIDRGIGMLLRPPSRFFSDAGLDRDVARRFPVRVDLAGAMMGGAFIPARLIPDLERLVERRTERFLKRLAEAEVDNVASLGLLIEACRYARENGLGLYEAVNVIVPEAPESWPPGADIVTANRKRLDPELRRKLEDAAKPPKKPSLMSRLFRRKSEHPGPNGHVEGADVWHNPWEDRAR